LNKGLNERESHFVPEKIARRSMTEQGRKDLMAESLMRMALEKQHSIYPPPDKKALAERCRRAWDKLLAEAVDFDPAVVARWQAIVADTVIDRDNDIIEGDVGL
jgi:hypothetical protein